MNTKEKAVLKTLKEVVKMFNGLTFPDDWEGENGKPGTKVVNTIKVTAKMTIDEVGGLLEKEATDIEDIELIPDDVMDAYNDVCDEIEKLKRESKQTGESETVETQEGSDNNQNEPPPGFENGGEAEHTPPPTEPPKKRGRKTGQKPSKKTIKIEDSGKVILELFNLLSENQVDELKPDTMRQVLKLMKK